MIPKCKALTVQFVLKQALAHPLIKMYMPNKEDFEKDNYIDKTWLFVLVNTLCPNFFDDCIEEYISKRDSQIV